MSRKIRTTDGEPFDFENGLKVRGQDISTVMASEANNARVMAEAARDAAVLASGIYATTAAGIAAVADGRFFSVPATDNINSLILYQRVGSTAIEKSRYPLTSSHLNKALSSALRLPKQKSFLVGNALSATEGSSGHGIYTDNTTAFNLLPFATDPFLLNCGVVREIPAGSRNSGWSSGYMNVRSSFRNLHCGKIIAKKQYIYTILFRKTDDTVPEPLMSNIYVHYYRNTNNTMIYYPYPLKYGQIKLTNNIYLAWALFAPKTDILQSDFIMQLQWPFLYQSNQNVNNPYKYLDDWSLANPDKAPGYYSLPSMFEFHPDEVADISLCDYLNVSHEYQKYNAFNMDKALKSIELLEKQNAALRDLGNQENYTRLGANIASHSYYTANRPFIDLMKSSANVWANYSGVPNTALITDTDGWIKGLQPGTIVERYVIIHSVSPSYRLGTYYVTWDGPATVQVKNYGSVNTNHRVISQNKIAVDLLALSAEQAGMPEQITLRVSNNTTSPIDVKNIKVYHADDEQDLLNGEIFQRDWLNAIKPLHCVRMMDFMFTNYNVVVHPEDYRKETDCSYEDSYVVKGVPPSIVGKLWNKIQKDIWICIPYKATPDTILFIANEIKKHYTGSNKIYVEYSNETWNSMFPVYNYLNNLRASLGVSTIAQATAIKSAQCWEIFDNVFGRQNVIHAYCGQVINGVYVNGCNITYNGYNIKDKVDVYGGAPYFTISGGMGLPSVITYQTMLEEKRYLEPNEWWYQGCLNVLPTIDSWFKANIGSINTLNSDGNSNIRFTTYEGGHHFEVEYTRYYGFKIQPDNTILITGINDASIAFDDGEEVVISYAPNVEAWIGSNHWTPYPIRRVTGNYYKIYNSKTDYLNDVPATLNQSNSSLTYGIGNLTRTRLLAQKYRDFLSSELGKKAYIKYLEIFRQNKVEQFQQYFMIGGWTGINSIGKLFQWGMMEHIGDYSPRARWYIDLCKNNPNGLPPWIPEINIDPSY